MQNDIRTCPGCGKNYSIMEFCIYHNNKYYTFQYCYSCQSDARRDENKINRENNAETMLKNNLAGRITASLKIIGYPYNKDIFDYLDYSPKDLKIHLENQFEPWMKWWNHGRYIASRWNDNDVSTWKWQIDHIIPFSKFKYLSIADEDFKKCWTLSNLRPLSAKQNLLDGVRRTRH
jgi:hypothetical protein